MKEIELKGAKGRGLKAKVDDQDYEALSKRRWILNQGYAVTTLPTGGVIGMHRIIMECKDPTKIVDHINGDRLDYQRENLRIVSRWQNRRNKHTPLEPTKSPMR